MEKQRRGLVQFLIVLIMIFLALNLFFSYQAPRGGAVAALTVLSLLACLYVMARHRRLESQEMHLIKSLVAKERQVARLDRRLEAEKVELATVKGRSVELGSRLQELTGLYRAISTVNAVIAPEMTCDTVLRAALELVDGDRGSVMLLDPGRSLLRIASSRRLPPSVVAGTEQRVGEGVAGWVAEHGEALLVTGDARQDERFRNVTEDSREVRFAMCVPLVLRDSVLGVLNLGSTSGAPERAFSEHDLRVATIFGQHASVAIQNAQLLKAQRPAA